jgi:hypothetical protein
VTQSVFQATPPDRLTVAVIGSLASELLASDIPTEVREAVGGGGAGRRGCSLVRRIAPASAVELPSTALTLGLRWSRRW